MAILTDPSPRNDDGYILFYGYNKELKTLYKLAIGKEEEEETNTVRFKRNSHFYVVRLLSTSTNIK
jgi:hypothetical protein